MMEEYFAPLEADRFAFPEGRATFGQVVRKYVEGVSFPELEGAHIAIFGVGEERARCRMPAVRRRPTRFGKSSMR